VSDILSIVSHRPWPLPEGSWLMAQTWNDLLFAHWPVPVAQLRPLVPAFLPIDTFDGTAWVAVAPFRISGLRARFLPPVAPFSSFAELNVRTYVKLEHKPGVFFFSLDAASLMAVIGARVMYFLPYFYAQMRVEVRSADLRGNEVRGSEVSYRSHRLRGPDARFEASYGPTGEPRTAVKGTLEHWLTERYCLYTVIGSRVYRGEIHHLPWPLQPARADIALNSMASAAGIELPGVPPLLHYAQRLRVFLWPLRRVTADVYAYVRQKGTPQVAIKPI